MNSGWIKLYRKITENPLYFSEPFTRMQAWIDMLILAAHDENFFYVRGNRVNINKGEIGYSQENLAKRWKWSRGRVSRFIKQLETDGMIVQQKSKIITTISIANYHTYQHGGTTDDTTDSTTDGRQTVQQTDINKNVKNEKNKETTTYVVVKKSATPDFVKFNSWLSKNAPYCANSKNFEKQITEDNFLSLKEKYNGEQIAFIIGQIENRKDLRKKYTDLYRTVLNWAKKEYGNG